MVGYFSKEKESASGYNLACILTLPQATPRPPHPPPPPGHEASPSPTPRGAPKAAKRRGRQARGPQARLDAAHAASIKPRSSHGAAAPCLCLCAATASDGDTQLERL